MKIKVNGEEKKIELDQENALLSTALNHMGYKPNTIVVELKNLNIPWFAIGGIKSNNISYLKRNGFKKVALVSQLMNSEDPKEDAIMILKELSHEN